MAVSTKVTLSKSGTTITVNGPPSDTDVEPLPRWATARTAGGTLISYKTLATIINRWKIPLGDLTAAQHTALVDFFESTVGGPGIDFTYTHTDGTSYTAQFVDTSLRFRRVNGKVWSTTLELQLVNQAVS